MQGKLFQKCTHLLYCSVLSLGGNVNTRRMSKPHMGSIFHIKKSMKYSGHRKLLCELSNFQNSLLLTTSDTKRTLMLLFLFTNSAQRELVSICTQSMRNCNYLSLHYNLGNKSSAIDNDDFFCYMKLIIFNFGFLWFFLLPLLIWKYFN